MIRRRPLFWAALVYAAGILAASLFFPDFFHRVPRGDVSRLVSGSEASILGGVVDSEVYRTPSSFGPPGASFDLVAKRFWAEGDKEGKPVSGRMRVYLRGGAVEPPAYGDEIVLKGSLVRPHGKRNPGGYDARAALERRGIRSVFYAEKHTPPRILRHGCGNPVIAAALTARSILSRAIERGFTGRDAAFLQALFLGERSDFDDAFLDAFMKTGTLHILSVSGFNVGFLIVTVFFLLKPFPISRDRSFIFALVVVWAYCLLVGWQAPVVRASLMASVFILASLTGRKADGLNVLGFAALVILLIRPLEFFDIGFRLSFAAVFALITLMPKFCAPPVLFPGEKLSLRERAIKYVRELFWVSFVCLFVSLPLTVQAFYAVTPFSVIANLVVVPAAFLLFFAGVLFFLVAWLPPPFLFLPALMKPLMGVLTGSLFFLERLPGAYVVTGELHPALCAVLVAGLALLFAFPVASPWRRAAAIVLFTANVFLVQEILRHAPRPFAVTVLDVGQGDAIYVEFPHGGNLLVDAGSFRSGDKGRRVLVPFLRQRGIRALDIVAVSHPQEDHIGGFAAVFDAVRVKNVLESGKPYQTALYRRFEAGVRKEKAERFIVSRGDRVTGFRDSEIEVLHPGSGNPHKNINDDSVVLRVSSGDAGILLTGDIGEPAMRELLASPGTLKADMLKVPHHGAKMEETGARFVAAVSPRTSVVSAGERNPFKHPRPETLRILESTGSVYRTDRSGAVTLIREGDGFRISSVDV